jgi:hypothetical protein
MHPSSILARLCALGSLIALLIVSAAGAAPARRPPGSPAGGDVLPGTLVPLYASPADSFTRIAPARQRPRGASAASIQVTFGAGWSAPAQAAFQYAAGLWAPLLDSPVPIRVQANWAALPAGVLGSAGPVTYRRNFAGAPAPDRWYAEALANRLAGVDLGPGNADINATMSSAFANWYFGTDGNTPAGQYDFVSIALHELGHGLGFIGSARVSSGQGDWGYGTGSAYSYDAWVQNAAGAAIINTGAFPNPSAALASELQSGALYFNGPAALAANGGQRPRLYAPASWLPGSSFSHLNEATYPPGNANSLMTPMFGSAEAIHNPGAITLGVLSDIGWATVGSTSAIYLPLISAGGPTLRWSPQLDPRR